MAQKVLVVCDVDGQEGAETVSFGYDGHFYEADLCSVDADKLQDALEPFVGVAREVPAKEAARRALTGPTSEVDPQVVRAWLQANGHQISDRGRIPETLMTVYNNAHA